MGIKVNEDDIKIDEEDIKEWTQNNTSRKIESLSFKLLIKNENSLKSRYCTLNLTENGQIDIIINMKLTESIKLEDVEKSFIFNYPTRCFLYVMDNATQPFEKIDTCRFLRL